MKITVTRADIEAWEILQAVKKTPLNTNADAREYINAGDEIIMLAAKIKAQRLTAAMQK